MAWGYVDEAKRTDAFYLALFQVPFVLCRLVVGDLEPPLALMYVAYLLEYSVIALPCAGVWRIFMRLSSNRLSKRQPDGVA